ncbi:MAG: hypothetical protein H5U08_01890 [Thermogutta sp.]|uniref:hypothetical protein n=1 Tax=Thermogutta sp. TaxID=1962930 RepID=UPI0019A95B85|nr:hypothetical protein [Thermogutta sp.]MBC7351084.1 hypothetical protein [Thermogutta sp.]
MDQPTPERWNQPEQKPTRNHGKATACARLRLGSKRNRESLHVDLAVTDHEMACTVALAGESVIVGNWNSAVELDGEIPGPTSPWKEICQFADREAHHREYERKLAPGIRQQRQITVCPVDGFALFAETFLSPKQRNWVYSLRFSASETIQLHAARETHEISLSGSGVKGLILPLAFPEWKQGFHQGSITIIDNEIRVAYRVTARRFYFPVFVALWRVDHISAPAENGENALDSFPDFTWRHLTVSECLRKVSSDEAVGYRIQIGDRQWVLYRSLTPPANRAVLGKNLISESLLGRFKLDGTISPLVEVELDDEDETE